MMISVVIPAYNEADRIQQVIREVSHYGDEVLVIDDGSTDATSAAAGEAGARVVSQVNSGYIAAVKRGFQKARGEIVVTLDADGEMPAERIPDLIRPILEGKADMVQGKRERIPRPSEWVLSWLANQRARVGDTGTGFRAVRTSLARKLELRGNCICGIMSLEVVHRGGRILEIPVRLRSVEKPRSIAWGHFRQFFYLLPWLIK